MAHTWNEPLLDIDDVPASALDSPQDTVVGSLIARARADHKLTVADVVNAIGLQERYLMAIESGEYWKLPSVSYGLAYVKSYARFIGLDPDLIADQFRAELAEMPQIHGLSKQANELDFSNVYFRVPHLERRWPRILERIGLYATASVVIGAVAAYFAWRFFGGA